MGQRGEELLAQARKVAPLAARRGEETLLLAKAQGCRVYDADNVVYIDLLGGGGSNLLGYGNQYVLDAVRRASTTGLTSGFHCHRGARARGVAWGAERRPLSAGL